MIYTLQTKKALLLCFDAHEKQKDKSGLPYVFHPFHLAEQMKDEKTTVAALLHDVVEDCDISFEDLAFMGFDTDIIDALRLLTHGDDVEYFEYVERIKQNPIAKAVKVADLQHNSDLSRFSPDEINERVLARHEKYQKAIKMLEE